MSGHEWHGSFCEWCGVFEGHAPSSECLVPGDEPTADDIASATEHKWFECDGTYYDCEQARCMFCDGGLSWCVRCSSFEGATTTDCPGVLMDEGRSRDVYAGLVDFRAGEWRAECSRHTPAYWSTPAGKAEIAHERAKP